VKSSSRPILPGLLVLRSISEPFFIVDKPFSTKVRKRQSDTCPSNLTRGDYTRIYGFEGDHIIGKIHSLLLLICCQCAKLAAIIRRALSLFQCLLTKMRDDLTSNPLHLREIISGARKVEDKIVYPFCNERFQV